MTSMLTQDTPVQALKRGLIAYWPLGTGAALDLTSSVNNGLETYLLTNNATVASAVGPSSNLRGGAQFNVAGSRYLSRTDSANLSVPRTGFTVAAWVYLDSKPVTSMAIAGKFDLLGQAEFLLQWNVSSDRLTLITSNDGTTLQLAQAGIGSPSLATWYYVVAWYEGSSIYIQANNGAVSSVGGPAAGVFDSTSPFTIGAFGATPAQFWDGRLAHVGLWRRVLTADERRWLYNNGNGFDLARGC